MACAAEGAAGNRAESATCVRRKVIRRLSLKVSCVPHFNTQTGQVWRGSESRSPRNAVGRGSNRDRHSGRSCFAWIRFDWKRSAPAVASIPFAVFSSQDKWGQEVQASGLTVTAEHVRSHRKLPSCRSAGLSAKWRERAAAARAAALARRRTRRPGGSELAPGDEFGGPGSRAHASGQRLQDVRRRADERDEKCKRCTRMSSG